MIDNSFNPLSPQQFHDPFPRFARLRKAHPVVEFAPGMVFVATDDAARQALKTPDLFSSRGNFELTASSDPPVVTQVDGEQHDRLRARLEQALNAQAYRSAHAFITRTAHELVERMVRTHPGHADLMEAVASPLPAMVIAHMIGVPQEDSATFRAWVTDINATVPGDFRILESCTRFKAFLHTMIDERKAAAHPPDDLVTRLVRPSTDAEAGAENSGARLTDDEVCMAIFQLLMADTGSTSELLGSLVYALLRVPERWEQGKADRRLIMAAIEETLRLDAPIMMVMRTCPHATQLQGIEVQAGSRVLLGLASANQDERAWDDPDQFRLDRRGGVIHLAFGFGPHFCLGAELARSQARILLAALFEHLPGLRLADGFRYEPAGGAIHRGPARLDVCW